MNDLSIILCSYNEEKNIEKTIKKLLKYRVVKEIIIIGNLKTKTSIIYRNIKHPVNSAFNNPYSQEK